LIRDPVLLLLDEATSALDAQTESAILQTLEQAAQGRTMVMITHRLSAAARCDIILVLEQGRLVEHGAHQQLLEQRGLYWRLYNEQQAGVLEALGLPIDPGRLVRVPLFAELSATELALVALRLSVERYEAGAVVIRQGDIADKLYVVGEGKLEVLVEDRHGSPRRVAMLGEHSYFGEIALLSENTERRTATVRATTSVELYSLHQEDFLALLRSQPVLAEAVARLRGRRGEQINQLLAAASGLSWAALAEGGGQATIVAPSRAHDRALAPPAILRVREGAEAGRTDLLDGRPVTLGRAADADITLPDNSVSREHCRISWRADAYVIEDLGSRNGTYVNGTAITSVKLESGDVIKMGDTVLEFTMPS
jgi:CRP-like cAMP-binding protein